MVDLTITNQESRVLEGFTSYLTQNKIRYEEDWTSEGEKKVLITLGGVKNYQQILEKNMIIQERNIHSHNFNLLYKTKDLTAAIDYLESFTFNEFLQETKDLENRYYADGTGTGSKARCRDNHEIARRFGEALIQLKNLQEITEMPIGVRKELYSSQAKVVKEKVSNIFNEISFLHRKGYGKKFKTAIKTLEVFHNRWE
jgi:hypothetical protein